MPPDRCASDRLPRTRPAVIWRRGTLWQIPARLAFVLLAVGLIACDDAETTPGAILDGRVADADAADLDAMSEPEAVPEPDSMPEPDAISDPDASIQPDMNDHGDAGDHDSVDPIVIDGVESASQHYIRVFFNDGAPPADAFRTGAYVITGPRGVQLEAIRVLGAVDGFTPDLLVQTAPQTAGVTYTLQTAGGSEDFVASADPGPALLFAEAVSPTLVRLSFDTVPSLQFFGDDSVVVEGLDGAMPLRVFDVRRASGWRTPSIPVEAMCT